MKAKAEIAISDGSEAETTRVIRPTAPLARRMEKQALIQQGRGDVYVSNAAIRIGNS